MTRIILLEGKEVGPVPKRFGHCDAELVNYESFKMTRMSFIRIFGRREHEVLYLRTCRTGAPWPPTR